MKVNPMLASQIEGLEVETVTPVSTGAIITFSDGTIATVTNMVVMGIDAPAAKPAAKPAPELAKAAAPAPPKPAPAPAPAPPKPAAKDPDYTWEDLLDMDEEELKDLIEEESLGIKTKGMDEEDLREAVATKLKIEITEPEEEEKADEPDDITWEDLKGADYDDLCQVIEDFDIQGIDVDDYDDDTVKGFRKVIAKKLKIEIPS